MRVFVTGATGFIGSAVVQELVGAGHRVLGLCRSDEKAAALEAAGAAVHRGSLSDPASLVRGATEADAVIHLAFDHDFSRFAEHCDDDRRVIELLADTMRGTRRPLLVTSGTFIACGSPGQPAREDSPTLPPLAFSRAASEVAAAAGVARGANVSVIRLPQVHDRTRQGLVSLLIEPYRQAGACTFVGDGAQRWPAAHRLDVARLYRLALEQATPGAIWHAVAEEGVSMRAIAETLGQRLGLPARSVSPEEAATVFGWLAPLASQDRPASSEVTRARLGWHPEGPGLLEDLRSLVLADH